MTRRGDYGYDAPYALAMFAAVGIAAAVLAIVALRDGERRHAVIWVLYALFFSGNALSFFYTTRHGKFHVWEEILDGLKLRGDERVLDMGCGRGAVSVAVARRLSAGRVTGIDLWSMRDQSGNAREATLQNASLEGVADRIDVETGDMRALPFPDETFDLVVSSLAIHNIRSNAARAQAVEEAWRVLKPGGRLAIADIRATSRYEETLRQLDARGITRRSLGWRFWYGNPAANTRLVTARKGERDS
jgi:ubiquinone/menaquinone biosynthesis C-methylase UbiE